MQWNNLVRRVGLLVREQHQHHEGGAHLPGFSAALTAHARTSTRARAASSRRSDDNLEGEDVARGTGGRHLGEAPEPAVRGSDEDQARKRLGIAGSRRADRSISKLAEFLEENATEARQIVTEGDRCAQCAPGRPEGP